MHVWHKTLQEKLSCAFILGFPGGTSGKEHVCQSRRHQLNPWIEKTPWRRAWQPTPVFLPGESHGQRRLWRATVPGVAKSWTGLKQLRTHTPSSLI